MPDAESRIEFNLIASDDRYTLSIRPPDTDGRMTIDITANDDEHYGGTVTLNAAEFFSAMQKFMELYKRT